MGNPVDEAAMMLTPKNPKSESDLYPHFSRLIEKKGWDLVDGGDDIRSRAEALRTEAQALVLGPGWEESIESSVLLFEAKLHGITVLAFVEHDEYGTVLVEEPEVLPSLWGLVGFLARTVQP